MVSGYDLDNPSWKLKVNNYTKSCWNSTKKISIYINMISLYVKHVFSCWNDIQN